MGDPRQIDHVTLKLADREAARSFYTSALTELGLRESIDPRGRIEYGRDGRSDFGFYAGDGRQFFQRSHIAFVATSRDQVDRFYQAAVANGGSPLDGPRERAEFNLYSAYVTDPDGNGVEVACPLGNPDK